MNAELRECLELVRVLDRVITFNEHHLATDPVRNASQAARAKVCEFGIECLDRLEKSWPAIDKKEADRLRESFELGEIPAPAALPGFVPMLIDQQLTAIEEKISARKSKSASRQAA
jgi:hypothetical protein